MRNTTLAIIKPDAVERGLVGTILYEAEKVGLVPHAIRMISARLTFWESFYAEHRDKPFFPALCDFMASGPCVFIMFRYEGGDEPRDACGTWRQLMGATDPKRARVGTLRRRFGTGGPANVVHGSGSPEEALRELQLVQSEIELL